MTLASYQFDRPSIEGHKAFAAKPCSFMGNYTIGKIAPCFQHGQPCFDRRAIHCNIACIEEIVNRL
ncbi:hypothetical protein GA0061105_12051 [Rhizobium aethiopicum]|uniref:Uncharacterized protein n=1 Tax=Rhizobium aethiopicum TaxID=1138170 RepID=A0A1C3YAR8_9HYPH|nr:hypothetical protein GA0061105_12051 [Rhizobium aethiopicum]